MSPRLAAGPARPSSRTTATCRDRQIRPRARGRSGNSDRSQAQPSPHLPRRVSALQYRLQRLQVLVGVDAAPEPRMVACKQLAVGNQALERLLDEILARPQIVEDRG